MHFSFKAESFTSIIFPLSRVASAVWGSKSLRITSRADRPLIHLPGGGRKTGGRRMHTRSDQKRSAWRREYAVAARHRPALNDLYHQRSNSIEYMWGHVVK